MKKRMITFILVFTMALGVCADVSAYSPFGVDVTPTKTVKKIRVDDAFNLLGLFDYSISVKHTKANRDGYCRIKDKRINTEKKFKNYMNGLFSKKIIKKIWKKNKKNNNVLFKDGKVYVLGGGRGLYCSWVKYKIVKQTKNQRVIKETFGANNDINGNYSHTMYLKQKKVQGKWKFTKIHLETPW